MSYPTYGNTYKKDLQVGDKTITIEVGKFAEQASAAVTATCGGTVVLATVALGRKVDLGYFPLSVEFVEKLFAGGIIKGSRWVKRDGRPSDDSILKGRVIDRTMRPMFPEGMTNEVQIIVTVFSNDKKNDADMLGLMATGVALQISDIPFDGPVTGLRVGYRKDGDQFIFNPTYEERAGADMDLIVSGTKDAIVMVEAGSKEVSEDVILKAFDLAQAELKQLSAEIAKIGEEIGKPKADLVPAQEEDMFADVKVELLAKHKAKIQEMVQLEGVLKPTGLDEFVAEIVAQHAPAEDASEEEKAAALENPLANAKALSSIFHELMVSEGRRMIVEDGIRPDGRKTTEIRPIWCEVDIFPGTHGSAMFKRGATQVLSVTTLGSPALSQLIEDMNGERDRFYIHHYNMPPFA